MPGARRSGVKKMPPNLASGLKRTKETKASEELERVRGWVKAAVENSDAFIGQSLLKPMDGVVDELLKDIGQSLGVTVRNPWGP